MLAKSIIIETNKSPNSGYKNLILLVFSISLESHLPKSIKILKIIITISEVLHTTYTAIYFTH
jgi:hypothetical protein